ncbi:MAG: KTSC domain-containing protein [Bdellovibrionales bacterium]
MERQSVGSSNVASIGYDASSQTLEIEFTNGSVYQYYNVEQNLFDSLMSAGSKGQFLNTYIKNAHPYSRVG